MTSPVLLSLLALVFIYVPGLLTGLSLGLRGWLLAGSAPALTLGVTAAIAVALPRMHTAFDIPSYAVAVLLLSAGFAAALRPWRRRPGPPSAPWWTWRQHAAVAAAAGFSGGIGGYAMYRGTRSLVGLNQTWDGMFHGSAIRHIAEAGNADPSSLAPLMQFKAPDFFYPDVFHAVGALVLRAAGGPVQPVLNALTVPMALVFAVSTVAWVRLLTPRPAVALAAAGLAGTFTSLPYEVISYGTLYPFALAGVVVPAVAALLSATLDRPTVGRSVALGLAAAGLFATHPSVGFSTAILAVAIVGWRVLSAAERATLTRWVWPALAGAVVVAGAILAPNLAALAGQAGSATTVDWKAVGTASAELGNLVFFGASAATAQVWLAAFFLLGAVQVPRYPRLWPAAIYAAVTAGLFVEAAAYDSPLSLELTQFWWNDRFRLAAMFIVPAVPIVAIGAVWCYDFALDKLVPRLAIRPSLAGLNAAVRRVARPAVAGLGILLVLYLTNFGYVDRNSAQVARAFDGKKLLLPGAAAAFDKLRELNGTTAPVVNSPIDGTAWAYSQDNVPVLFKSAFAPKQVSEQDFPPAVWQILQGFDQLDRDPVVQNAVRQLGIRYAIFGNEELPSPEGLWPGLQNVQDVKSLTPVWQNAAATIYRVDVPGADQSES